MLKKWQQGWRVFTAIRLLTNGNNKFFQIFVFVQQCFDVFGSNSSVPHLLLLLLLLLLFVSTFTRSLLQHFNRDMFKNSRQIDRGFFSYWMCVAHCCIQSLFDDIGGKDLLTGCNGRRRRRCGGGARGARGARGAGGAGGVGGGGGGGAVTILPLFMHGMVIATVVGCFLFKQFNTGSDIPWTYQRR